MTVWIRIALLVFSGWLYGTGIIGDEVKTMLTTDPAVAASIEAIISSLITLIPIIWWRLAKKFGWST